MLEEVRRAAKKSAAPFLEAGPAAAHAQWSRAMEMLERMAALDRALSTAKAEATDGLDAAGFSRLKSERDAIRRAIKSGEVWATQSS